MKILTLIIVCILSSCSTPKITQAQTSKHPDLITAEILGHAIYEKDNISAAATDELAYHHIIEKEKRVQGWITLKDENGWIVRFIGKIGDDYYAFHDVRFSPDMSKAVIESHSQPVHLTSEQIEMFVARQTAIRALPQTCPGPYNTVVLPGNINNVKGWIVYMLAASKTPNEIMVGGHYRMEISSDGKKIFRRVPLSKSCLKIPPPQDGKEPVFAYMTHVISDMPIEIHVYLNLLHKKILYVMTELGLWLVDKGEIKYLGKLDDKKAPN